MDRRVDLDLFARLMRISAAQRGDVLEFVGEGSALTEDTVGRAENPDQTCNPQPCSERKRATA
jgi:hypothetical protein